MEFFLYLNTHGQQLIRDLISAKFHVYENVRFCNQGQTFGYVDPPNKIYICTKNIKNSGYDPYFYVSETLYHEAVHAAQLCNRQKPLGLSKASMPLPWNKLQDIRNSLNMTKNYNSSHKEHEAYYLEDKPEKVRYYVRKFCF